jgi:hypothetical protein
VESASRPLDALQVLAALARHDVDYVLIGGAAMQVHGHVRTTQDVDVIAAWTPENMTRLAGALGELGAGLRGVDADLLGIDVTDARQLYDGGNFLLHTRHGDLDVFAIDQTAGAPGSYEQLRARAVSIQVGQVRLLVAHPEDLIRMKTAAAQFRDRPEAKRRQDLDDIAVLERLRQEQQDMQDVRRPTRARPIEEALGRPPAPTEARPQRPPSRGPSRGQGRRT